MSSLPRVSQSGDMPRYFLLPGVGSLNGNASSKFRDCLFPGGEEGAGGVLVAEEAFYQV